MLWFLSRNNLEYCFEKIQERWRGVPQWTWYKGKINRKQPGTTRIIMECGLMIVLCVHWASFLASNCNENWHIYLSASSYQAHIVQHWQMFSIRCRPCDVNSKYFVTLIAHRSALINGTEGPFNRANATEVPKLTLKFKCGKDEPSLARCVVRSKRHQKRLHLLIT